jgi:hypothetical protein
MGLWSHNFKAALGLGSAQVNSMKTGKDQLRVILGHLNPVDRSWEDEVTMLSLFTLAKFTEKAHISVAISVSKVQSLVCSARNRGNPTCCNVTQGAKVSTTIFDVMQITLKKLCQCKHKLYKTLFFITDVSDRKS